MDSLSPKESFPYVEPSDLPGIKTERPKKLCEVSLKLTEREVFDKIFGGWLGRCVGCLLGKPVEGLSKEKIEFWLKTAKSYPLTNYFPTLPDLLFDFPEWLKDRSSKLELLSNHITRMKRDDDIDYMIINLLLLETKGFGYSSLDVGDLWLSRLPFHSVFTAERVAYRNLVNGYEPPQTAIHINPFREWIGAQIRADVFGYVTPGRPELAAELAFRDASLSHVKNGIYGEMFFAAMISAAFASDDVEELIYQGLSVIPRNSRLSKVVNDVLDWSKKYEDWKDTWSKIIEEYGHYSKVHTLNNAAIVLLGLLYGEGALEKTITTSVMSGLDTDCNGATAGSVIGVMLGANNLPEKWTKPLNNRLESNVSGYSNMEISNLAQRTCNLFKKYSGS